MADKCEGESRRVVNPCSPSSGEAVCMQSGGARDSITAVNPIDPCPICGFSLAAHIDRNGAGGSDIQVDGLTVQCPLSRSERRAIVLLHLSMSELEIIVGRHLGLDPSRVVCTHELRDDGKNHVLAEYLSVRILAEQL